MTMDDSRRVLVFKNYHSMADFLLQKWQEISADAVRRRGSFAVALSGGETPRDFYRRLAGYKGNLPWDKTDIFFVDERFVPESDSDSNYRMIRETLLRNIPVPPGHVHPISTAGSDPSLSAQEYASDLADYFGLLPGALPEFDLIMLGIGKDGHTASLFPGSALLAEKGRLAGVVLPGHGKHDRITLTLPVLNNARNVIFLATGREKAAALRDVVERRARGLPASLISPGTGNLLILTDEEAASLLSEKVYEKR
jgi:6-phosphogluconolactonase